MTSNNISSMGLAEEMMAIGFSSLSTADVRQLEDLILDYCAVTLCGSVQPWGHKMTEWAYRHAGEGKATLFGSGAKAGAVAAALVNGTAGHGYELDDTHERSHSHPGAVVITAALAVAEERASDGREILAAIAAGYEAMARIGMAGDPVGMGRKGFHMTCLFGAFGAATAAAKLMGLDAAGLARAWGLALSMIGGSSQFAYEPAGTMVKRMHAGLPAQNGVLAAQLSSLGMTAPVQALEGGYGFFNLYGTDVDASLLAKPAGAPLEIHEISLKPYSCCRKFHSLIDALEQVTDGFTLPVERITAIEAHTPTNAIDKHQMRRPESIMAAQYAMPYIVGATLAFGPRRYDAYGNEFHRHPHLLSIIDKVTAHADDSLQDGVPGRMPARAVIRLDDGSVREATVKETLGSPERPLDRAGILAKAKALAEIVDPSLDLGALERAIGGLSRGDGAGGLTGLLSVAGYAEGAHRAIAAE